MGLLGLGGGGEFAGLETEEFLDFAVEQLVVVVRKLAIGIRAFEFLERLSGAEITVFSHNQCFVDETGEGIEQAGVIQGVFIEPSSFEGLEYLSNGKLDYSLQEFGFIATVEKIRSVFALKFHLREGFLLEHPIHEAAVLPIANVLMVQ